MASYGGNGWNIILVYFFGIMRILLTRLTLLALPPSSSSVIYCLFDCVLCFYFILLVLFFFFVFFFDFDFVFVLISNFIVSFTLSLPSLSKSRDILRVNTHWLNASSVVLLVSAPATDTDFQWFYFSFFWFFILQFSIVIFYQTKKKKCKKVQKVVAKIWFLFVNCLHTIFWHSMLLSFVHSIAKYNSL